MKDLRHHLRHLQKKVVQKSRRELSAQNAASALTSENNTVVSPNNFLAQNSAPYPPARRRW